MAAPRLTVFVTRSDIPKDAINLLEEQFIVDMYPHPKTISRDALLESVKGKDGIFCVSPDRIDKEIIESAGPQLKIIGTMSLGYEHIDINECKERNIIVCNCPNSVSVGVVAEITVGLMLAVGRKIVEASKAIQRGEWTSAFNPTFYIGRGLMNTTVGIVGMGRIGQALLKRIVAFDVLKVLYYDVHHPIAPAEMLGAKYAAFKDLLKESDYVVATCNLTEESKGLFNSQAFSLMKPSAVFINTSRGGIVDQEALYEALKNKKIKGAGIDVMYPEPLPKDDKLVTLPNIVLLPHIAAAEETAMYTVSTLAAKNIIAVLKGDPPLTPVF